MSDYSQLMELRRAMGGANVGSLTANITSGSPNATLSATSTSLMVGRDYNIAGTGIPGSTTTRYLGSTAIVMSKSATATNATAAVTLTPVS